MSAGLVVLVLAGVVAFTVVHLSSAKAKRGGGRDSPSASASPALSASPSATPSPTRDRRPATSCTYTKSPPASRNVGTAAGQARP